MIVNKREVPQAAIDAAEARMRLVVLQIGRMFTAFLATVTSLANYRSFRDRVTLSLRRSLDGADLGDLPDDDQWVYVLCRVLREEGEADGDGNVICHAHDYLEVVATRRRGGGPMTAPKLLARIIVALMVSQAEEKSR